MGSLTDVDSATLRARAYLSRVAEPGSVPLWSFVQQQGPIAAAGAIRAGDAEPAVLAATGARRLQADPDADLEVAARHDIRLVVPESTQWPHFAFAAFAASTAARVNEYRAGSWERRESGELIPPLALWVRGSGDLASAAVRSVGIVGSRAATSYGEFVSADLGFGLGSRGVLVVSGGAFGIDAAAHRGALAAEGQTILVSAAGPDRPYPTANASLYERVAESGLVVSESPPGVAPHRHRFLTRNRLIAALSTGTVVVEAARRSGAANTAAHCVALGRPLMAVPGPVTSSMSAGCHDLLRRSIAPARMVTCVDDVLQEVGSIGEGWPVDSGAGPAQDLRTRLDELAPQERRVFEAVSRCAASPEEIAQRGGLSPLEVIRAVPILELAGLVEADGSGFRLAAQIQPRRSDPAAG